MQRFLSFILALMLPAGALALEDMPVMKHYPLSEQGEAVVNDIAFSADEREIGNDGVFYEIFVSSFSDSNGDGIGDLRGILNRLDYLNDGDPTSGLSLGVDGLWLTPIFASPSYHKYDVTDYDAIDPAFGTEDDLRELVQACHERGVKVILDLPINHTGKDCVWFRRFLNAHLMGNTESSYYDYYNWCGDASQVPPGRHYAVSVSPRLLYEANFSDSMPELNFDHPAVRAEMLRVARHYLALGVDGFRFDAAKYIYLGDHAKSAAFWQEYLSALRADYPELYAVGEVWDSDAITDLYAGSMSCFNFTASQTNGLIAETAKGGNANRLTAYLEERTRTLRAINPQTHLSLFIANHDTDRAAGYLTLASGRMQMAANLYLLSPGSPFIYYGEEIGLRGSRGGATTDANRRLAMRWGDGDTVADPVGTTYDPSNQTPYSVMDLLGNSNGILTYYKRLLMIRHANPEIAKGVCRALPFTDTKVGGFLCDWEGNRAAVIHNPTTSAKTISLVDDPELAQMQIAAVIGVEDTAELSDGILTIGAQTSVVLR